jgi:hypothetical protein
MADIHKTCSIGQFKKSDCFQTTYTPVKKLQCVSELSEEEKDLIHLRSGINLSEFKYICSHHSYYYLNAFESYQTICVDPLKKHKKPIKKSLRIVSLSFSKQLIKKNIHIKPGQKICSTCRNFCEEKTKITENESDDELMTELNSLESRNVSLSQTNAALDDLGLTPIKLHTLSSHSKRSYYKRKVENVTKEVREKISKALDYNIEFSEDEEEDRNVVKKAKDFDKMISLLKEKTLSVGRSQKIQILTLAPESWSKDKVVNEFKVSEYMVRQARKLKQEKGILAIPDPKKGKTLSENTVKLVTDFYENDENSRVLPGTKDRVSIKKNVYMQKRLILSNLRELYSSFKWEYPDLKVGFSKFCNLRPKWCILAGSAGTHTVCVCSIHQNVKLLLDAVKIKESYKDLIKMLVCNVEDSDCMLRHCDKCPSNDALIEHLTEKLSEDYDLEEEIILSQWVNTDRAEMVKQLISVEDFISVLSKSLDKLIPHHFITKSQSKTFKKLKEDPPLNTAIVVMDFSENYSYTIQNEIQSYHWNRGSCTIHPVGVYLKKESNVLISNHCFISDDLEHDTSFVNYVQREITKWLKENHPEIDKVHYFTDGCAGQYKNRNSFKNLSEHYKDFNVKAEHSFFATSHGKSICDGLGGTVKRIVRKASLQLSDENQIQTANAVYEFCKMNIEKINFQFIDKIKSDALRLELAARFSTTRTIPGTRSFHHFKPLHSNNIEIKRTTDSPNPAVIFSFQNSSGWVCVQPSLNNYVAANYDGKWYFGLVKTVFNEEEDAEILFLHPPGSATSFYWPQREDLCIVPLEHIINIVEAPQSNATGRMFYFKKECVKKTENCWMMWKKYFKQH